MPLFLATHIVETVTAKVQLTMIMLVDHVKRRGLPETLRLRMVIPTSGNISISLWDAPSPEELLGWLQDNLQYDATHEVHEVQEEFSWGLTFELARLRAAEKVAAGGRGALDRITATAAKAGGGISRQLEALDQRTHLLTAAGDAFTRMRTAATGIGAGSAEGATAAAPPAPGPAAGAPAPLQDASSAIAANMSAGIARASTTLSWLGSALKEQLRTASGSGGSAAHPSAPDYASDISGARVAAHTPAVPSPPPPPPPSYPPPSSRSAVDDGDDGDLGATPHLPVSSPSATAPSAAKPLLTQPPPAAAEERAPALGASRPAAPTFTLDE